MTDEDDILSQISEARQGYKAFVEAVDEDLRRERTKRLAERQGLILNLVARAVASNKSKRAIMQAYGTKDFYTISRMIESLSAQIELLKAEAVAQTLTPDWLEVEDHTFIFIDGIGYFVTEFDEGEIMLDQEEGTPTRWDGAVLTAHETNPDHQAIYNAVKGATNAQ